MKKHFIFVVFLIGCVVVSGCQYILVEKTQNDQSSVSIDPVISNQTSDEKNSPDEIPPAKDAVDMQVPEDWGKFENNEYGFEIFYPPNYSVLTDDESLYGYPNGVALLYGGGQSYDIAIQIWGSREEAEQNFGGRMDRIVFLENNGVHISLDDITLDTINKQIISSFNFK